jgi:hypothetical protein
VDLYTDLARLFCAAEASVPADGGAA